jgi:proliferating cell nuclear antigen PCNA
MPIFKCKTGEANQIKVLAELLAHNLKNGCFEVSDDGITLRMSDQPRKTLIDLDLQAENFALYKFTKGTDKLGLGLNLNHFYKMLKSIKKKDSLGLFIDEKTPNIVQIKTIPKENTRVTTSSIKIQNIQNIDSDVPMGYGKPVIVPSPDFQKMCKELSSIGSSDIRVEAHRFYIDFLADADDIMTRTVRLGENDVSDAEQEDNVGDEILYTATFATDQFARISKMAGLSNIMQIFPGSDSLPLLFRTSVGSLGKISIYIKSKELIDKEAKQSISDSDDSDTDDEDNEQGSDNSDEESEKEVLIKVPTKSRVVPPPPVPVKAKVVVPVKKVPKK